MKKVLWSVLLVVLALFSALLSLGTTNITSRVFAHRRISRHGRFITIPVTGFGGFSNTTAKNLMHLGRAHRQPDANMPVAARGTMNEAAETAIC